MTASRGGPGWVPILLGAVGLVALALSRWVPRESFMGKALTALLTRQGQYRLSSTRLTVFLLLSLAVIGIGIALVAAGH